MRAVIQRASEAEVRVDDEVIGKIEEGLVVLLGIGEGDSSEDVDYLADKILQLRIFGDEADKMNLSAFDVGADVLVVPNFTLYGDCSQGRRPDFNQAAPPNRAEELYEEFVSQVKESGLSVATGQFKAMMEVDFINDGPVTFVLESE